MPDVSFFINFDGLWMMYIEVISYVKMTFFYLELIVLRYIIF